MGGAAAGRRGDLRDQRDGLAAVAAADRDARVDPLRPAALAAPVGARRLRLGAAPALAGGAFGAAAAADRRVPRDDPRRNRLQPAGDSDRRVRCRRCTSPTPTATPTTAGRAPSARSPNGPPSTTFRWSTSRRRSPRRSWRPGQPRRHPLELRGASGRRRADAQSARRGRCAAREVARLTHGRRRGDRFLGPAARRTLLASGRFGLCRCTSWSTATICATVSTTVPADLYQRRQVTHRRGHARPNWRAPTGRHWPTADGDGVVAVHISSGAVEHARARPQYAAAEFGGAVRVVDSRSAAMGTGFVALAAARARATGADLDVVAAQAESAAVDGCTRFIVVHRLDNLRRSGRIGAAASWLGTALALKPLLRIDETASWCCAQRVRTVIQGHCRDGRAGAGGGGGAAGRAGGAPRRQPRRRRRARGDVGRGAAGLRRRRHHRSGAGARCARRARRGRRGGGAGG